MAVEDVIYEFDNVDVDNSNELFGDTQRGEHTNTHTHTLSLSHTHTQGLLGETPCIVFIYTYGGSIMVVILVNGRRVSDLYNLGIGLISPGRIQKFVWGPSGTNHQRFLNRILLLTRTL